MLCVPCTRAQDPPQDAPSNAWALRINVHGPSYHIAGGAAWNDATWGAGLEAQQVKGAHRRAFLVGTYYNSLATQSIYGAVSWSWKVYGWIRLGIGAGLVTGYDGERCVIVTSGNTYHGKACASSSLQYTVIPMLWPAIIVGKGLQFRIVGHPVNKGALHLMMSIRL